MKLYEEFFNEVRGAHSPSQTSMNSIDVREIRSSVGEESRTNEATQERSLDDPEQPRSDGSINNTGDGENPDQSSASSTSAEQYECKDCRKNVTFTIPVSPVHKTRAVTKQMNSNRDPSIVTKIKDRMPGLFLAACKTNDPFSVESVPTSYDDAITGPEKNEWAIAIEKELEAHEKNDTWKAIDKPSTGVPLTTRWVFTKKKDVDGKILKFKARLVARGYSQREGIDYYETYAPVAKSDSIRALLASVATQGLEFVQFDISSAFLNGELDEFVVIEAPEGVQVHPHQCLRLKKALYGLKQASRAWNSKFNQILIKLGMSPSLNDPCVYFLKCKQLYATIHVDDGLIMSKSKQSCMKVVEKINSHVEARLIDSGVFLGISIKSADKGLFLSQSNYIQALVEKSKLENSRAVDTPLADIKTLYNSDNEEKANIDYRSMIRRLLYCATNTRSDILFATILLSRFIENNNKIHATAVRRVIMYLRASADVGLYYPKETASNPFTLEAYSDADWAGDPSDSKSTSGLCLCLNVLSSLNQRNKQSLHYQAQRRSMWPRARRRGYSKASQPYYQS